MEEKLELIEITSKKLVTKFLDFPSTLYKDDSNWIRPLDEDIEKIFNREKNRRFKIGDAIRWILVSDDSKVVGRIAAFYDEKTAMKNDQPTGGCGFFDCINDNAAAAILFDAAKEWLMDVGMEAMDGPINFGSREHFWGCLSDGFYEPIYNMPYNHSYYNDLFETYGFYNFFNQYTFHLPLVVGNFQPIIKEKADKIRKNPDVTFGFHDKKSPLKSAYNFMTVFNAAWANFEGVKPITESQAKTMFKSMKQVADSRLIIFAYYKNDPIAFFIMIPDLYQIIGKFNGKFHLINKLRLLYLLKVKKICTRAVGLIFGVVPQFQGQGVAEGMIVHFEEEVSQGIKYTDLEMNWIGDFNPKMIRLVEQIGSKIRKIHITYRYLFDQDKPANRAKVL